MSVTIVISVVSDNHPGIIEPISKILSTYNSNWIDSNMISLEGKFSGIISAQVPDQHVDQVIADLDDLNTEQLKVFVDKIVADITSKQHEMTLELIGQDRVGIVRDITQVLARHDINILKIHTECSEASMSGENLFSANIRISVPDDDKIKTVQDDLHDLANELMVDIIFSEDK